MTSGSDNDEQAIQRFTTPWRVRLYSRLLVIPLILPLTITVLTGERDETLTGTLGGDLPAFYNAGLLVNEVGPKNLYDAEILHEIHASWSNRVDQALPFLYPPFVAAVFSLLAQLPYRGAYVVYTLTMMTALALAVILLRKPLLRVSRWPLEAVLLAASFYPMFRSMMGGQNTALTLLFLVGGYRALDDDRPVLAGAILGLLFYKPQFAVPVAGLLLLRHRRALIGMAGTVTVLWSWGAAMLGPSWIAIWFDGARRQSDDLIPFVPVWNVDVVGMSEEIFGHSTMAAYGIATVVLVPLIAALMWTWWTPTLSLDLKFAALACGLLLIPLHVLWYEAGLLILAFAVLANRLGRTVFGRLLGLMALSCVGALVPQFGGIPQFAVVALTTCWVATQVRLESKAVATPADSTPVSESSIATDGDGFEVGSSSQ